GTLLAIELFILAGASGLYRPSVAYGFLLLSLVGPHRAFLRDLRLRKVALASGEGKLLLAVFLGAGGTVTFFESLTPTTSQDALVYHLAVPARYVDNGGFVFVEGNFFAQFPQNIEMLFTLGLLLKGSALAQWYHWLLGAAAAASIAAFSRALH